MYRVVASRTAAACPVQLQPAIVNTAHCSLQPHAAGDNNNYNCSYNYNYNYNCSYNYNIALSIDLE